MTDGSVQIIAGLGNPGERYRGTRHNIGFMVVERLIERLGCDGAEAKFNGLFNTCRTESSRIGLLRPQTFMNRSGTSVSQTLNWFKVDPLDNLLVAYDDLDLPFGEIRLRRKGSAGGHNGLTSIIEQLGTTEVQRLRIGIGRPSRGDTVSYVLNRFSKEEEADLGLVIDHAADAALMWLTQGLDETMGRFNGTNVLAVPE
jgi:peptidyl-tRNA hydrolase, PTH1 family